MKRLSGKGGVYNDDNNWKARGLRNVNDIKKKKNDKSLYVIFIKKKKYITRRGRPQELAFR